jgi:hypothetical protein
MAPPGPGGVARAVKSAAGGHAQHIEHNVAGGSTWHNAPRDFTFQRRAIPELMKYGFNRATPQYIYGTILPSVMPALTLSLASSAATRGKGQALPSSKAGC